MTTPADIGTCDACGKRLAKCEWCGEFADEHDEHGRTTKDDCPKELAGYPQWYACETGWIETFRGDRLNPPECEMVCARCAPEDWEEN